MTRWCRRAVLVFLVGACPLVACEGGQTGQPSANSCSGRIVPAGERVNGITPAELARAFEGRYTAALRWLGLPDAGSPPANDEITIVVTYEGADGTTSCGFDLGVEVSVDITTRDTGVHETGRATLSAPAASTDLATLAFSGVRVNAVVTLRRAGGAVQISGTLESLATDLPGKRAEFPPNARDSGTGGGP